MSSLNDIRTYQGMIRIRKHHLDDELEMQAELLHKISDCTVRAKSDAMAAKDELDRIEGSIYSDAKQEHPKATVPELQGITMRNPARRESWKKYQQARQDQEEWEGLHEAWKSRGFALRALVDLRLASYYTSDSPSSSEHNDGRRALNEARRAAQERQGGTVRRRTLTD